MRTKAEVERVLGLIESGHNDCQISRMTGIPRRTVMDWRHGRRPDFSRRADRDFVASEAVTPDVEDAYAYVLGLYLGDGYINAAPRTHRLRITLDGIYPDIVSECRAALSRLLPNRVNIEPTNCRAVTVSVWSRALPHLFPQHGPGLKHQRPIVLLEWQRAITGRYPERLIRGLIHSDGCRHLNRVHVAGKRYEYPRYSFCNHSDDIRAIFCEHLDLLAIPWRRMNRWNISIARREGVARLDEFVGPKT
jgi:hypothetical protein